MKLWILAVGNKMPAWVNAGFDEYRKRMPREARLELVEIKPEKRAPGKTARQVMEAERDRIAAAMPARCYQVALDQRGRAGSTEQLAADLGEWMALGSDVAFVIGGADGLHQDVRRDADRLLSLSPLTLPHGLVRVILAEQLYRALSIIQNHPYHRA